MTSPTTESAPDPRDGPEPHDAPDRPGLYVVRPGEDPAGEAPAAEPVEDEDGERVAPEAPWQYRLGEQIAEAADALPGLWANRRPSFAERVQYSLTADWTTAPEGQTGRRAMHLIGTLFCLFVDAVLLTPLQACCEKPSRLFLLLAAFLLLGYAF